VVSARQAIGRRAGSRENNEKKINHTYMKMEKIMKLRRIMTEYYYYPMRGRGGTW
jgi:hypothetical protein